MEEESKFEKIQSLLLATRLDNAKIDKKKDGMGHELSYLSWAWAWAETIKACPTASYEIERFGADGLPYQKTPEGYMVWTKVTIEGITKEMWLPVMDSHNLAMKEEPYSKKTRNGEIQVVAATMTDINKTIMRCLVKNLAMFGLGLSLYTKGDTQEDMVNDSEIIEKEKPIPCSDCGNDVKPYGKLTAKQFAENTYRSYGRILCYDCATKAKAEREEKAKEGNEKGK